MHIVSIWHGCGSRSLYSGTEVVHPSGESAAGAFNVACWLPLIIKPVKRQVVNVLAYQACRSPNQRLSMNIRKKYEFHNDSVLQSVYTIRSGNVCRRGQELTPNEHGMRELMWISTSFLRRLPAHRQKKKVEQANHLREKPSTVGIPGRPVGEHQGADLT